MHYNTKVFIYWGIFLSKEVKKVREILFLHTKHKMEYTPVLKIDFGTWYNWLLFSKEPSTMAHHPSNQLINLIDNNTPHRVRSPQIYMSSVRSPNSAPSNILSPLSTREMNSTSSNHHLYVIKLSTLAGSGYTEWDLITVNYTYQSNLTN